MKKLLLIGLMILLPIHAVRAEEIDGEKLKDREGLKSMFIMYRQALACQMGGFSFTADDIATFKKFVQKVTDTLHLEQSVRDELWNQASDFNVTPHTNVAGCQGLMADLQPKVIPFPTSPF